MADTSDAERGEAHLEELDRIEHTPDGLLMLIGLVEIGSHCRVKPHRRRARYWEVIAVLAAWLAAFSAGISAVTVIQDQRPIAAALAIFATALTTFTAVVKPADRAAEHAADATFYKTCEDRMRNLRFDLESVGPEITDAHRRLAQKLYDATYTRFQEVESGDAVSPDPMA